MYVGADYVCGFQFCLGVRHGSAYSKEREPSRATLNPNPNPRRVFFGEGGESNTGSQESHVGKQV